MMYNVAFRNCVERGANHVICHPYFLSYGRHVREDIPCLMKEAALKFPGVSYVITKPLGMQNKILELMYESIISEA
jgi:sirohydrochlorin ferrochelatase